MITSSLAVSVSLRPPYRHPYAGAEHWPDLSARLPEGALLVPECLEPPPGRNEMTCLSIK